MINRAELKEKGKAAFKANYWSCVIVSLILAGAVGTVTFTSGRTLNNSNDSQNLSESIKPIMQMLSENPETAWTFFGIVAGVVLLVFAVVILIDAFVINPLALGCRDFFLRNSEGQPDISVIGEAFRVDYKRKVKTMFLKDLYIGLWSLLFLIPGIIKAYEYALVPYIISEDPDIAPKEALKRSAYMMDG